MSSVWKEVSLVDVCSVIKRGISPKYAEERGVVVINQRCIRDQKISTENARLNDLEKKSIPEDRYLKSYDVLVNSTGVGTLGRVAQLGEINSKITVDSHVTIVRLDNEEINTQYFGLALRYNEKVIENLGEGSTGQTELSRHRLGEIKFVHPTDINEQKAIAHILGTLDDKIELNRKMNETLEAMAQALFQSWFIDFDPVIDNALKAGNPIPEPLQQKAEARSTVIASATKQSLPKERQNLFPNSFEYNDVLGKWIPEGWKVEKFDNVVEVKYGKDHKKLEEGKFPCYGSGGVMRYVNSTLCDDESVLIPRKGTLTNLMYVRKPFWSVDTMFFTKFKESNYVKYIFYFLKRFDFTEMNVGSAVPSMTTAVLNSIDLIKPTSKLLEEFENEIEPLLVKKEANNLQTESLTKQRDMLLPQLISGKLRLPKSMLQKMTNVEVEKEVV